MLFSLSVKNMKKSMKDYAIYFMTLVLGVAIFYIFNSLDSQQAMKNMNSSTREIIKLMVQMLNGVSVFVSCILAFLIVYANNFLIRRRKKEFGVYMMLGMSKGQISRILVGETFIIGLISLVMGLAVGILGGQFMSVLVVKLFEGSMKEYTFVFSKAAFGKTILYFGIMFLVVLLFNSVNISRCRLIELLCAGKQSERVKVKNPLICFVVFVFSVILLGILYYIVAVTPEKLNPATVNIVILSGSAATFLFFWSLSGFFLNVMKKRKKFYLKNLNVFVLRQVNSKINTTVFAMTIICLMLFLTICVLSSGLGMNYAFRKSLRELTPVDLNVLFTPETEEDKKRSLTELLEEQGFDTSQLKDGYVEMGVYETEELTMKKVFGSEMEELGKLFLFMTEDTQEDIVKLSDYNRLAKLYGMEEYELGENEYLVFCDFASVKEVRDKILKNGQALMIGGKTYIPARTECQNGFLQMMTNHSNTGFYVFPDEAVEEEWKIYEFMAADYAVSDTEEVNRIDQELDMISQDTGIFPTPRSRIISSSAGLATIITFIAIYLGIIFLITGAAILALKELSESSDNKSRYEILRKIGADEKMINRALLKQIGIFFLLPLTLACVHSIFGMEFIRKVMISVGELEKFNGIATTAVILIVIYGGYFLTTYMGSRQIIRGK